MGASESQISDTDVRLEVERRNRGIKRMDQTLREKLRSGVQYHMKVVIRGPAKSGKTMLWRRLQGLAFQDDYSPSDQIEVACINWTAPNLEGTVKVDVWDVIDEAPSKDPKEDKTWGGSGGVALYPVDSTSVSVFGSCDVVIFLLDYRQDPTGQYIVNVVNQAKSLRSSTPILVLINFRDLLDESSERTAELKSLLQDSIHDHRIDVFHVSMKNCFGLRLLYKYLLIPFLKVRRDSLERALALLQNEISAADTSFEDEIASHDYSHYLQQIKNTKYAANERGPRPDTGKTEEKAPDTPNEPSGPQNPDTSEMRPSTQTNHKIEEPTLTNPDDFAVQDVKSLDDFFLDSDDEESNTVPSKIILCEKENHSDQGYDDRDHGYDDRSYEDQVNEEIHEQKQSTVTPQQIQNNPSMTTKEQNMSSAAQSAISAAIMAAQAWEEDQSHISENGKPKKKSKEKKSKKKSKDKEGKKKKEKKTQQDVHEDLDTGDVLEE